VAGLVLPPLAALFALAAMELAGAGSGSTVRGGWFAFHTAVSTLGMASLGLASAMAVLYIVQDRALKAKQTLQLLERFPALTQTEHLGYQALVVGFVLLTLGILTGIVVNWGMQQRLWVPGVKQLAPLLAWVIFAIVLVARGALGFRGRKSAYLTIAGFALGLLTVLGMAL
jgi:ABC-type uncharacterized transport system permease subunit